MRAQAKFTKMKLRCILHYSLQYFAVRKCFRHLSLSCRLLARNWIYLHAVNAKQKPKCTFEYTYSAKLKSRHKENRIRSESCFFPASIMHNMNLLKKRLLQLYFLIEGILTNKGMKKYLRPKIVFLLQYALTCVFLLRSKAEIMKYFKTIKLDRKNN